MLQLIQLMAKIDEQLNKHCYWYYNGQTVTMVSLWLTNHSLLCCFSNLMTLSKCLSEFSVYLIMYFVFQSSGQSCYITKLINHLKLYNSNTNFKYIECFDKKHIFFKAIIQSCLWNSKSTTFCLSISVTYIDVAT